MKNINKFLIILLVLIIGFIVSPSTANAQNSVGGGLAFGTGIESAGIGINAEFRVADKISVAPSFIYFFPRTVIAGIQTKQFEVNINGNYYLRSDDKIDFYALAGLNITRISIPIIFPGLIESTISSTEVGLNVGAGANFKVSSKVTPFAEMKYAISNFDQLVIFGGVKFGLN